MKYKIYLYKYTIYNTKYRIFKLQESLLILILLIFDL